MVRCEYRVRLYDINEKHLRLGRDFYIEKTLVYIPTEYNTVDTEGRILSSDHNEFISD